jgi:hypothetical protein
MHCHCPPPRWNSQRSSSSLSWCTESDSEPNQLAAIPDIGLGECEGKEEGEDVQS